MQVALILSSMQHLEVDEKRHSAWRDWTGQVSTYSEEPSQARLPPLFFFFFFFVLGTILSWVQCCWHVEPKTALSPSFRCKFIEIPYCHYYLRVLYFANFCDSEKIAKLSTRKNFYQHNYMVHSDVYRPILSQTCCTVATAHGAAVVGRKHFPLQIGCRFDWPLQFIVNVFFWMAFWCSVFRPHVVRRLVWQSVSFGKIFLQLFLDRTWPFLHRLCRSSSGHERHDIWRPNHTTTSTLDRDELGADLLFWNSSSDKCFCEHADRCQILKKEPGASERPSETVWVRERERERASHLDKKLSRGVQMLGEADWVPWITLEHTMIPQRSSVITRRWAHLSCTLFCILINCQYVCQEMRKL